MFDNIAIFLNILITIEKYNMLPIFISVSHVNNIGILKFTSIHMNWNRVVGCNTFATICPIFLSTICSRALKYGYNDGRSICIDTF